MLTIRNHNGEALEANLSARSLSHNASDLPEPVVLHVNEGALRQRVCLMAGEYSLLFMSNTSMTTETVGRSAATGQCQDDTVASLEVQTMTGWSICDDGSNYTLPRDNDDESDVVCGSVEAIDIGDDFTMHRALSTPAVPTLVDLTGRTDALQGGVCSVEWGAGKTIPSHPYC